MENTVVKPDCDTCVKVETDLEKVIDEQNKTITLLKDSNENLRKLITIYRTALTELVEDMKDANRLTSRSLNKTQILIEKGNDL